MPPLVAIFLVAFVSLLFSFFCSLLEACLYSVSRSQIETMVRRGDRRGRVLARLRLSIDQSIATILIINTVANTVGAAVLGALVSGAYGSRLLGWFSAGFTFAVLFFAEITPKSIGVRFAGRVAPALAIPLQLLVWAIWPFSSICVLFTRLWGKEAHISHGSAEDIISLANIVRTQGRILPHEAEWVANALRLDEVTAYELMTPNPVVARVRSDLKLRDTSITDETWCFSRLPVCAPDNPDEIVGIVHRITVFNALARDQFDLGIGDLMEKAEFVKDSLRAHLLLDQFLRERRHLFCVQDDAGQFKGVVTLEDVLECLLGREIVDETDLHENMQAVALRRKSDLLSRRKHRE